AEIKNIRSAVSGDPDVLLVPDLESGNMLAKQLAYLAAAESAGIVLGTRVPIALTSRADNLRSREASTAVLALVAPARRTAPPPEPRGAEAILVLNAGSSSLKFETFVLDGQALARA